MLTLLGVNECCSSGSDEGREMSASGAWPIRAAPEPLTSAVDAHCREDACALSVDAEDLTYKDQ